MPVDRHKQAQTLPCRLSQTSDHPARGDVHPASDVHTREWEQYPDTPAEPCVPLAQAWAEPSLITISSVSTATQMERAWERCPGVPRPATAAALEDRSATGPETLE